MTADTEHAGDSVPILPIASGSRRRLRCTALVQEPGTALGLFLVVSLLLAPWLPLDDPTEINLPNRLLPPSAGHLLGSGGLGILGDGGGSFDDLSGGNLRGDGGWQYLDVHGSSLGGTESVERVAAPGGKDCPVARRVGRNSGHLAGQLNRPFRHRWRPATHITATVGVCLGQPR